MTGDGATDDRWFDDAAGPVVRPYAMTRGRTRSAAEDKLDLIAVVVADRVSPGTVADRDTPQSVAELAAELDLPVGVVRVLIGDLLHAALVRVSRPVPPAELPDERILREVINGLRAL